MPNKKTNAAISAERAWHLAVDITSRIGTLEARAINVLLYLVMVGGHRATWKQRLKVRGKFLRRLRIPGTKPLPRAPKGRPLFAFLYDTPANTNNLKPVFQAAEHRCWDANVLRGEEVNLQRMGLEPSGASICVLDLISFLRPGEWPSIMRRCRKQFAAVHAEFAQESPECAELIWANRDWVLSDLIIGMLAGRGLQRLYETWEPNLLVSTSNMWPFDQAMYFEAERMGIPAFVIQHGITNRYWWPFTATKMFLWGTAFESELRALGAPAEILGICGMPAADRLFTRYKKATAEEKRKPASSFVVLSDTQAQNLEPELYARFKAVFTELVKATPQSHWAIKLHPLEDDTFYKEMFQFPNFKVLPKATTLEQAVTESDVACTLSSTSGLEAMMMRRPLMVLDLHPMIHQFAWWPKAGGGVYTPTLEAARAYVKKASSDGEFLSAQVAEQDRFLANNFANPGNAAETCLDMMERTVQASHHPQNCCDRTGAIVKRKEAAHAR